MTSFCFTKFISYFSTPISFNNMQPFLTQCCIFWRFKKCNTSFNSICIIRGTLTSWNAILFSKTTSIIFVMTFLAWILIISLLYHSFLLIFKDLPDKIISVFTFWLYVSYWNVNKLYLKEDYFQCFSISLFYHLCFVFHCVFTFYHGPPRFHD